MKSPASPFAFAEPLPVRDRFRRAIFAARFRDENQAVAEVLALAEESEDARRRTAETARGLARKARAEQAGGGGLDAFLNEYGLSTREGVALMCLAEALLRIPDAETADALMEDKLAGGDWRSHIGRSASAFVNASTWALMLAGRAAQAADLEREGPAASLRRLIHRLGEPVARRAMIRAVRIMGRQFVMERTIGKALRRAAAAEKRGARFSYDMLGEAARTAADAESYFQKHREAVAAVGQAAAGRGPVRGPGVSVKLSALHPRYEFARRAELGGALREKLTALAGDAKAQNISLCVDAEESERLEPSLDLIESVALHPDLAGWDGFGLAVQACQKRAPAVLDFLADLARRAGRRLMTRLVKGAYWDAEIKRAQQLGLADYPVFTRKESTDACYLACAKKMLADPSAFFPQFATHNARSAAAVFHSADGAEFEFQRLHGMGEALFSAVAEGLKIPCRVYAPVGGHEDLLAYLARRLLENGANTSFVNRLVDERAPLEEIVADPALALRRTAPDFRHPKISRPRGIFLPERESARGPDCTDEAAVLALAGEMENSGCGEWTAHPTVGDGKKRRPRPSPDPARRDRVIGETTEADAADAVRALDLAAKAAPEWERTPAERRAAVLDKTADLLEQNMARVMALAVREAGRTIPDAAAEVREAADFCRYYAARARAEFAAPVALPGPAGERNAIRLRGRGVFVCISPWNFPAAIFTGQVAAALAAGNAVVAKPAEQTPLCAALVVRLFHRAGTPPDALHFLPGRGETAGAALVSDPRTAGVAFTGSVETARTVARALAARTAPLAPLIAETGGLNAMIADNSALPEQATRDIVASAFNSAGQRCSALRVLFARAETADRLIEMIAGAMGELKTGDPGLLETDVGPVIDGAARTALERHAAEMGRVGKLIRAAPLDAETAGRGFFFAPRAYEIDSMARLRGEVFGPILHIIRWRGGELDRVLAQINAAGFGLTVGVHSRIGAFADEVCERVRAGNAYVNRDIIGAVVGAQPFGGEGFSGTGPKAGGPRYLHRFAAERVVSEDTAAAGGNASLMTLDDAAEA